jgi:hypothetical protein
MQINPYAAAAMQQRPASMATDPGKASWGEIMDTRSPMYANSIPERKSPRDMLMSREGLFRLGANILAANPAHGWGSAIGQGIGNTVSTFDKMASEDLTARQKAQHLAADIRKHVQRYTEETPHEKRTNDIREKQLDREDWRPIGLTPSGQPALLNSRSGELINGVTREPLSDAEKLTFLGGRSPSGGAGGNSVFNAKMAAWLNVNPNDQAGALEYASGRKSVTPGEQYKIGYAAAQKTMNSMLQMPDYRKNAEAQAYLKDPQAWLEGAAKRYMQTQSTGAAPAPTAAPAASSVKPLPLPTSKADLKMGALYTVPALGGAGMWDGEKFVKP